MAHRLASALALVLLIASTVSCGGSSGGSPECATAADCPASAGECRVPTCSSGACGFGDVPAGVPLSDQVSGDCQLAVCDGAGAEMVIPDEVDIADDGNPCTVETCENGTSVSVPEPAGAPCGSGLSCDGAGACVECLVANDCPGSDTACMARTCTAGVCGIQFQADGAPCNDGLFCSVGDACVAGVCQAGVAQSCDDGIACTLDVCDEGAGGACSSVIEPGSCLIGGTCAFDGQFDPGNFCRYCSASSPTSWTFAPAGSPCVSGGFCDGAGTCVAP